MGGIVALSSLPRWGSAMFWADLVRNLAVLLVAAAVGDATRAQRAYVVAVEQRALEAERTREEEAARRVDEERLRIARELHDITAHSLSLIAVQSGAALHILDTAPEEARKALQAIRETSKASLSELRAMLGVLRAENDSDALAPLAPSPQVSRVEDLAAPLRDAGLAVSVLVETGSEPLPAIVDASAYRIVQEALTNALRHAGRSAVEVCVLRQGTELVVRVADDGAGSSAMPGGDGHGIAGMRERALALGGTFSAGPVDGGGWLVVATLPVSGRES